ncbi:MAG: hypothetical protein MJ189_00200 [Coriobacteriales bacterium]|nr:hypothetical protein [Coriobacteriales bacterium]
MHTKNNALKLSLITLFSALLFVLFTLLLGCGNSISDYRAEAEKIGWHDLELVNDLSGGYKVTKQVKVSNIVDSADTEKVNAAWKSVGGTGAMPTFSDDDIKGDISLPLDHKYYIFGSIGFKNSTPNFDIKSSDDISLSLCPGRMGFANGTPAIDGNHILNQYLARAYIQMFLPNEKDYYSRYLTRVIDSKTSAWKKVTLTSNEWGPYPFVICIGDAKTPESPNGCVDFNDVAFSPTEFSDSDFSANFAKLTLAK